MALTPQKKFYFKCIAICLPFLLFGIIECGFRLFTMGRPPLEDPYILLYSPSSIFKRIEIDGKVFLKVHRKELYSDREIQFTEEKPKGTIRIFCVGGSASAGWPHLKEHAYSTYLNYALSHCYPSKKFEVINLSGHAFGSNRVRLIFEELLEFKPDLILLYSGNNEFLEERFYRKVTKLSKKLHQIGNFFRLSHFYSWTEGKILKGLKLKNAMSANRKSKNRESIESKIFQQELELRKNPEQFARLLEHYQYNIEKMVSSATKKKIPTFVLTVPVNLKGWFPNVSAHQDSFKDQEKWNQVYKNGRKLQIEEQYQQAIPVFKKLVELDPNYAESHFRLGQCYHAAQQYQKARKAFLKATDQDYNPFRAITLTNQSLVKVSKQFNASLVDLEQIYAKNSNGCPGYDLFLDYVHPNVKGNLIITQSVFEKIKEKQLFGSPEKELPEPNQFVPYLASYKESEDQGVQWSIVFLCGMMHQYEQMIEISKKFLPIARKKARPLMEDVLKIFPTLLEMKKKEIYDIPVSDKEKKDIQLKIQNFYKKHYDIEREK